MNSQTTRRPETKRPARPPQAKRYTRQTAHHVATRRDGKPLIFGWGGHLSRKEKDIIQRRAIWTIIGVFAIAILVIFAVFWINFNIIIPNQPITSVNGQNIPQSDYHKLVALKGQVEDNTIDGKNGLNAQANTLNKQVTAQQTTVTTATNKVNTLKKQIAALHGNSSQRTDLENQLKTATKQQSDAQAKYTTLATQLQTLQQTTIPNERQLYVQSQIGNDSATWLQNDVLIRAWLAKQPSNIQSQIEPTATQVNNALNTFKNNLPIGTSYSKFLSNDNVSDADVHTMMTLIVRRNNMQSYLASQITSPARQVRVRDITLSNQGTANNTLKELKNGSDFAKIAKQNSLDTTSKSKGGELGWFVQGQYAQSVGNNISAVVDNWIFGSGRQANEFSPVLSENGTFHIIQIEQIDPSRAIDNTTLQSLKSNALTVWLLQQQAIPGVKIGSVDQNKLLDPGNMPQSIPASPPTQASPSGGATGGATGGTTTNP